MKQRRLLLAVFLLVVASLAPRWAAAQSPPSPAQPVSGSIPTIKTETRLVLVDTVVTDKQGHYIRDLSAKDFKVWEDNKEQPITSFSSESDAAGRMATGVTTWSSSSTTPR